MKSRRAFLATPAAWAMQSAVPAAGLALPAAAAAAAAQATQTSPAAAKVLRFAFPIAETTFDPAQVTDLYSRTVLSSIFDAPLEFEFLARPARMRPATLRAMPEVSADFKTFTFRLQPGIFFADDAAFQGRRRELVAADYVYAVKRHYDPRWKSGNLYVFENAGILGLSELRKRLLADGKPFDYDAPVEGLRVLDRHSFQVRLRAPSPRLLYHFADGSLTGALAREVVEFYGDKIGEHPVGTGAFRLAQWKRSSRIVLERNPGYRELRYDEEAPVTDARLQAVAARFKGQRLPLIDRVVISIIEEPQPRWLSFLSEEQDVMNELPADFSEAVVPNNRLAPNLAKKGIGMVRYQRADISYSYFAMEDPVVGGYEPHKVALRRAISLGVDVGREIRVVRRSQAIPAQGIIGPNVSGYDPRLKTEMSDFDRGRAKALLDMHGYIDRDGDGWREQPDGSPLQIEYATQPDQTSRALDELWGKNMAAIGIRMRFAAAKWPENLKSSRAGKLQMWGLGWSASTPDGDNFLGLAYGPNKGGSNHARFNLPAYNALYEKEREMPDGPERLALMQQLNRLLVAYMPYKVHVHRTYTDLTQPWVLGYHRNLLVRDFWRYVDIDNTELQRRTGGGL